MICCIYSIIPENRLKRKADRNETEADLRGDTLTYSVESYADAYYDTEIPNPAAFVVAMMRYGDAAQVYFN